MAPHPCRTPPLVAGLVGALVAGAIALAALGCATPGRLDYTPQELRAEVGRRVPGLAPADVVVPFEVDEARIARARELMRRRSDVADRVSELVDALSDPDAFGLHYEWATTATALETLERGGGNCFSLASVLVGLARGAGLRAHYVEVVLAHPRWRTDGDLAVHADHIAAVVASRARRITVDFSGQLEKAGSVRVISDLEALAHFYNNRGYELIHVSRRDGRKVPWRRVEGDFEIATRIDPQLARAWNNLGVARSRLGEIEAAEGAYQRAVELDDLLSAHLNLGLLNLRQGDLEDALVHLRAARRIDPRNPQLDDLMNEADVLEATAGG